MRVHILGINYSPEQTGIAPVSTGRAEHLAAQGHAVTMCTAPPYYPQWRVAPGWRRLWYSREHRHGVTVLRCPVYVPRRPSPVRRALHELSFVVSAVVRSLFAPRPDVLLVVSPPLGLGLAAVLLGRWWGVPYVFDVEDLQPDAAVDLGMVRRGALTRALYALEAIAYRHAALVSTLTDAMRARLLAKGLDPAHTRTLGLWVEPELLRLEPHADDQDLRRELDASDEFLVVHIGNMGVKQGLDVIIDAARRTSRARRVRYVLVGDGATRAALEARVHRESVANVTFLPLLARERLHRLLSTADACIVTQQRTVGDIVFPSKLLTLLAAGKPVLASVHDGSDVARVIRESGAGLVVPPEDPAAICAGVEWFAADPERRRAAGVSARAYARQQWHRETTLAAFADALQQIARTEAGRREWSRAL